MVLLALELSQVCKLDVVVDVLLVLSVIVVDVGCVEVALCVVRVRVFEPLCVLEVLSDA